MVYRALFPKCGYTSAITWGFLVCLNTELSLLPSRSRLWSLNHYFNNLPNNTMLPFISWGLGTIGLRIKFYKTSSRERRTNFLHTLITIL